jgi:hypothetical protein
MDHSRNVTGQLRRVQWPTSLMATVSQRRTYLTRRTIMKRLSRDKFTTVLDPKLQPAITIASGEELVVETWDAYMGVWGANEQRRRWGEPWERTESGYSDHHAGPSGDA